MIKLQRFDETDFNRLIAWIPSDRFLTQWGRWRFTFPLDILQLTNYLKETKGSNPSRIAFKAIHTESGKVVGHAELDRISRSNGTASLCRMLIGPAEMRNKGLGKLLVQKILLFAFKSLALRRIDLQVYSFNKNAISCYERLGFKHEGRLRKYVKVGEEFWDLIWMGILKEEWHNCRVTLT